MPAEATVAAIVAPADRLSRVEHGDEVDIRPDPPRGFRWAMRVLVVLPIVTAVGRALVNDWIPVGDAALLAVRARDVGTADHPWLGSWTSASLALGVDVNNPGALYSDLAAPVMWTIGRIAGLGAATAIAVGLVNLGAALGIVTVGRRIDGWCSERWALVLAAALTWSMGSELLIDIWQPHALLLPFCLLLMLTVAVANGDAILLPIWVAIASLVVQTHVGYVYVTVALGMIAVIALVIGTRAPDRAMAPRAWWLAAGVLALAWLQPLYEQVFGRGVGNLQRLLTNTGGGDLTLGPRTATKVVAAIVALPPWWTRFGYEDSVPSTPLTESPTGPRLIVPGLPAGALAALSVLAVSAVLAVLIAALRRPAQRAARVAAAVSLVAFVTGVAGLSIQTVTRTGLRTHQVQWLFALAVFVHVSAAWGVAELLRGRWRFVRSPQALDVSLASVVLVLTLFNLPFHAHDLGPTADRSATATLRRTFRDLSRFDPDEPVIYDVDNLRVFEPYSGAVQMRLRELGVELRFEDEVMVRQYGEHRRAGRETIHVRQYERGEALTFDPQHAGGCVLSMQSGVDAATEARADRLIAAAADELSSGQLDADVDGLPQELARSVTAALTGDRTAAVRLVTDDVLAVLVDERRIEARPALNAAADARQAIVDRVNSTLLIVATPATACGTG